MIGIRKFEEAPKIEKKNFGGIENLNFYKKTIKF